VGYAQNLSEVSQGFFMNKHRLTRLFCLIACLWLCVSATALSARAFDEDHKEKINGTTLHFRVRGADKSNPYLLILHGGPGFSAHMFYPWGPSLEKQVNVVYLDQRGCGESERIKIANLAAPTKEEIKDYTIPALIADIEGVRRFLHVERWYVLGHSWGGMLGLEYVAAHPKQVVAYIHMNGLLSVPMTQDAILKSAEGRFNATLASDKAEEKEAAQAGLRMVKQLRALPYKDPQRLTGAYGLALGPLGLYFVRDQQTAFLQMNQKIAEAVKPYNVPMTALFPAGEPSVALVSNENYLTRDDRPLLKKITVPTLVINGKQDGVITPETATTVQKGVHGASLLLIDDSGHFPFLEQPEKTASAVLSFVAEHPLHR